MQMPMKAALQLTIIDAQGLKIQGGYFPKIISKEPVM